MSKTFDKEPRLEATEPRLAYLRERLEYLRYPEDTIERLIADFRQKKVIPRVYCLPGVREAA